MGSMVRPEFGPTLPALLRGRFGVRERLTVAGGVALAALVAVIALLTAGDGRETLTYDGTPSFTLLYTESIVKPTDPRSGELARIGNNEAFVSVRRIDDSALPFGALPLYGDEYMETLRAELPDFKLLHEGKALIWGQPGYRVEFSAGDLHGNDVLMFPDDVKIEGGVLLSFRRRGGLGKEGTPRRERLDELRKVQRSFQFGTGRK